MMVRPELRRLSLSSIACVANCFWQGAGDCPLCMREVNMLKRRDEGQGKIAFVDIASPAYDPKDHENISFEEVNDPLSTST